jgi:phage recombination protein Bet
MSASRSVISIAPRHTKPAVFNGTDIAWRQLCDLHPNAETPEVLMAVIEYCAVRNLDPFKRPVHVVPMWNSKLRRRVQVVMPGINEIEITAHRTNKFAGLDEPKWGRTVRTMFKGAAENDDGSTSTVEVEVEYPETCSVTAYRLVGNVRQPFTEQLYWLESYATAGFKSTVPNTRWRKAPRQMLHKCTKAAVLRLAFPEEGLGYAAEEMEDQHTPSGGVTIEGKVDQGHDPGMTDRDRQADAAFPPPSQPSEGATATGDGGLRLDMLDEPNGTTWLRHLRGLLDAAETYDEYITISGHHSVRAKLANDARTPAGFRDLINEALANAHERLAPSEADTGSTGLPPMEQALADMMAEVDQMDLIALAGLPSSASWRKRVNDLFPLDADVLAEHIAERTALLRTPR